MPRFENTGSCHGFYGASSMERLPVEVALTEQTHRFRATALRRGARTNNKKQRGRV
jgi:predicted TIM-barrel enzyme